MIISVAGPVAFECANRLFEENIAQIKIQFPGFFIKRFRKIPANIGSFHIEKNAAAVYISEISEGGIFAALWKMCEELGCGCRIDLKKIPVRQDITEVLELFGESPYEVSSGGSFIIVSEDPIEGADIIGFTNRSRSRIVDCGDWKRYLTPLGRQAKDTENRKGDQL